MKPGLYRHSKSRRLYTLLHTASHSETLDDFIVYQAEYGERKVWVRPAYMWDSLVEFDGGLVPRFVWLADSYEGFLQGLVAERLGDGTEMPEPNTRFPGHTGP